MPPDLARLRCADGARPAADRSGRRRLFHRKLAMARVAASGSDSHAHRASAANCGFNSRYAARPASSSRFNEVTNVTRGGVTTGVSATIWPATVSFTPRYQSTGTAGQRGEITPATQPRSPAARTVGARSSAMTEKTTSALCTALETRPNPDSRRTRRNIPRTVRMPKKPKRPAMTMVVAWAAIRRRSPPALIPRILMVRKAG